MRNTALLVGLGLIAASAPSLAGPIFLTGHDPDFHAQGSLGAQTLLSVALNYATTGTYSGGVKKFLFVESEIAPPAGHLVGEDGLNAIGLVEGVNYDEVDAAGLAALASFSGYSAIVVASNFGGLLTEAELDELILRKADIATFINSGGGLAAFAECGVGYPDCIPDLVTPAANLFGFLPVVVSSVATNPPYSVTLFGASLGLTDADVNDPTHNSFGLIGGLNIVDTDAAGTPTTLAGNVTVGPTGFNPVPEPSTLALLSMTLLSLMGLGLMRRRAET